MNRSTRAERPEVVTLDDNPVWYKDAIIYELHVRAFCDGNADGIGDFPGLTQKLDYLQDLGVTALWLLPFYPSPLRDDGYDIADYTTIHPHYGTLQDFKVFLREAHRRGLRVITELVINHTSDQHPWFQRARHARPGSPARNFYVWSDTPERYTETRIIFKDFEPSNWTWDPVAKAYFWHRFYSHQPDLNFDNPAVGKAVTEVMDFWLGLGVDGLRLDAVPYLYEREGTNCENLPETHVFLKKLRRHVDQAHRHRMLLAEANQWPEDAVRYFGEGDECHMAFHFPVMPRLFMAVHMEDRFPIIDILTQTPSIPETSQWALFLRNHDELTLEMVTDEDRDYMYRVYASDPRARINLGIRRRLAPLLGSNRRKFELLNSLLFSLPGTPVIYYGDEIGMGDNIYLGDRNGVRTPMQWSADRNAGFSRANPQRLFLPIIIDPEHHYEAINVEAQQQNLGSLLWWMKRLIRLRKRFQSFGQGSIEFLYPENRKVLVFIRRLGDELILVVANLSRFVSYAELDLSAYRGTTPVELFGQTAFPPIGEHPYFITLGPHAFYWFKLEPAAAEPLQARDGELPRVVVKGSWEAVFEGRAREALERVLPRYVAGRRWFAGKARQVRSTRIVERMPLPGEVTRAHLVLLEVEYTEGDAETYLLPLAYATREAEHHLRQTQPGAVIAGLRVEIADTDGVLYDALAEGGLATWLLDAIERRRRVRGTTGELVALPSRAFRAAAGDGAAAFEPSLLRREQSNTSILYGNRLILKVFRRIQDGENPDVEVGRFLTERVDFPNVPPLAGTIEYRRPGREPASLAILQGLVPNEGDAWTYTLDALVDYFDHAATRAPMDLALPTGHLVDRMADAIPDEVRDALAPHLASAQLVGRRTGELHVALATDRKDPAFAPEPFTPLNRRSLYQGARSLAEKGIALLARRLRSLPDAARGVADELLAHQEQIHARLRVILERNVAAERIRCHGDYHLGQLLFTGKDFVIIDFEGEPARPLSERRHKRSPLSDVAGMLRSFDYAVTVSLRRQELRPEDVHGLEPWARLWKHWVCLVFLQAYYGAAADSGFLPRATEDLKALLDFHLIEKALYELAYELNNRPDWVDVPVRGILGLVRPA
jgi:maltose alpha-D-glucosyltransferase/alpha-amylase